MQMPKGENQTLARQINQRLIAESLLNGHKSCTDIAKELRLSNTAVAKILKKLQEKGLCDVIPDLPEENSGEKGRKPILYGICKNKYMSACINLAKSQVMLCDFCGDVIAKEQYDDSDKQFTIDMIQKAEQCLYNLVEKNQGAKLKAIMIITFGMIDSLSGEYVFATRFENSKGINIVKNFKERFSEAVIKVVNDTKLYLFTEQNFGLIKNSKNAVLLHVDIGVSAAIMINGESYNGDHGFSGEVGISNSGGNTLEEQASIGAIKKLFGGNISWNEIVDRYLQHDKVAIDIIDSCADVLSNAIINILHIFDCRLVIMGRITELGDEFLQRIKNNIDKNINAKIAIDFSNMNAKTAWQIGGHKYCIDLGLESLLRK